MNVNLLKALASSCLPRLRGVRRTTVLPMLALLLAAGNSQAFQLQTMDAERVNLNDYVGDGQWTLVMFWSTDCIPCEQQKPMIEAFNQDHAGRDARVVGVALDGLEAREDIEMLIERHHPSYPNLVVFTDVFFRQYQELTGKDFRATPSYLLYNPAGELVGARSGVIERAMLEAVVSGAGEAAAGDAAEVAEAGES